MSEQKKHEQTGSKPQATITVKDSIVGSIYAQSAVVTVTDIDITINFIYVNPTDTANVQVVSRVTMPRPSGEELAKTLLSVVKMHEERKKEKKDGTNN